MSQPDIASLPIARRPLLEPSSDEEDRERLLCVRDGAAIMVALALLASLAVGCDGRALPYGDDGTRGSSPGNPQSATDLGPSIDLPRSPDLAAPPDLASAACPASPSDGNACDDPSRACLYQRELGAIGTHVDLCICNGSTWDCTGGVVEPVTVGCLAIPPDTQTAGTCTGPFTDCGYCVGEGLSLGWRTISCSCSPGQPAMCREIFTAAEVCPAL